jgi:hypothetical protein
MVWRFIRHSEYELWNGVDDSHVTRTSEATCGTMIDQPNRCAWKSRRASVYSLNNERYPGVPQRRASKDGRQSRVATLRGWLGKPHSSRIVVTPAPPAAVRQHLAGVAICRGATAIAAKKR